MWTHQTPAQNQRGETGGPLIRAMNSLRDADARVAELMTPLLGVGWSVTRQEDFDGDLMLLITQEDADLGGAQPQPDFALHRTETGIQLGRIVDEHYDWLGEHGSVSDAMRQAASVLESGQTQIPAAA